MIIQRNTYLQSLIARQHNGMIKVITGVRRCGKSFLLFNLFRKYLEQQGTDLQHIISIALDDRMNRKLRNPDALCGYVHERITDSDMYYILLDEVQFVSEFEDVLNSFLHIPNADVYVTGSNARFLSKDVITEFRGRGDEVRIHPLSFREYLTAFSGSRERALDEYMMYGGLPQILSFVTVEQKVSYLKNLFTETYITDIKERYRIQRDEELEELINIIASSIGSLTNPNKLVNTFKSVKNVNIDQATVKAYLDHLCDSFLVERTMRYDVKGRHYIDTPSKYYFTDMGLRNARLNFRQDERTHIMENVIYNELRIRGFNVDVGIVPVTYTDENGSRRKTQLEIDFVCNLGSRRYYVQSAYHIGSDEKRQQEQTSLVKVSDSFKKIVVVGDDIAVHRNEQGITTMSLIDFLTNEHSLDL